MRAIFRKSRSCLERKIKGAKESTEREGNFSVQILKKLTQAQNLLSREKLSDGPFNLDL